MQQFYTRGGQLPESRQPKISVNVLYTVCQCLDSHVKKPLPKTLPTSFLQ